MDKFKKWIKAAGVRAVKTVAQTAVATIGTSAVLGDVNWVMVASASALAGVISLLTSVSGIHEVNYGVRFIKVWWSRGESNSCPKTDPPTFLHA